MKDLKDLGEEAVRVYKEDIATNQGLPEEVRKNAVKTLRSYDIRSEFPRPRRFNETELDRAGVTLVDASAVLLKCKSCGTTWSPNPSTSGKLPPGYWRCPQGCNL